VPGGLHIVVVEDNPDGRETLAELLKLEGHRVDAAGDGLTGAELIVQQRPHVALVDIGLPTLDGYEVARFVRSRLGAAVKLIALTGYGQEQDKDRALQAGFDGHLVKPFDVERLFALLPDLPSAAHRSRDAARTASTRK
jgi:CheY-like chemotaxis protein